MQEITPATPQDLASILSLMEENGLPKEGIAENLPATLVVRAGERIVGNVTLEIYGRYALLRSVAVAAGLRGSGLGRQLTQSALDIAAERGVAEIYLLTNTAEDFFRRFFGFSAVDRALVPAVVKESVEFTSVCPVSTLVMVRSMPGRMG